MYKMMAGAGWARWWHSLLLLLVVAALNPALARDVAADAAVASEQGLLWQVAPPTGGKVNYLFGTIHSEDTRVTTLPPRVRDAFSHSQHFVMEMIPDSNSMLLASQSMMLAQGSRLRDIIGKPLFDKTMLALRDFGVPAEAADHMKPWAVMVILSMPKPRGGQVLDMLLYSAAEGAGMRTSGLETAQEQLAVFDSLTQAEQVALLAESVEQYPQMEAMLEQMHTAYVARDLTRLAALSDQYSNMGDAKLAGKINNSLVDQRNLRMAERMERYLREGGAFVAVGALHLPGEQGLLSLLRKRGYRVISIY
jgi:uncharacterized protein